MKICVVVPSAKQLVGAGVRIRYQRIIQPLATRGWILDIVPMEDLVFVDLSEVDFVLFSKCQDARSLVYARKAVEAGACVGIDLFDDYFSQTEDARFLVQRQWLREIGEIAQFAICSTPRMFEVAESYLGVGRCHILSDPYDDLDTDSLGEQIELKAFKARRERKVSIVWFGIASNPSFPVGLDDLASFSGVLRRFAQRDYGAHLTILTNVASIGASTLERLRALPVPFSVVDWTEDREKQLLERSLVAFLPVNFQPFSIAKSLNRGVSALVRGAQVLSAGYPLYAHLDQFSYSDPDVLIDDLEAGMLKLSSSTLPQFASWMTSIADPETESASLVNFLSSLPRPLQGYGSMNGRLAILFVSQGNAAIAHFAKQHGALTIASPFVTKGKPIFDVEIKQGDPDEDLVVTMSDSALEQMSDVARERVTRSDPPGNLPWRLSVDPVEHPFIADLTNALHGNRIVQASLSGPVISQIHAMLGELFPACHLVDCETDPVFAAAGFQNARNVAKDRNTIGAGLAGAE